MTSHKFSYFWPPHLFTFTYSEAPSLHSTRSWPKVITLTFWNLNINDSQAYSLFSRSLPKVITLSFWFGFKLKPIFTTVPQLPLKSDSNNHLGFYSSLVTFYLSEDKMIYKYLTLYQSRKMSLPCRWDRE